MPLLKLWIQKGQIKIENREKWPPRACSLRKKECQARSHQSSKVEIKTFRVERSIERYRLSGITHDEVDEEREDEGCKEPTPYCSHA